ncbi:hypothetical protein PT974_00833 [Cladobotryum mycophilum]|uniref:RNA polymerase I-specific transcription initiation factor rrn5 n=1 Tax=Cladobotryum mycophilum TaxID=491253 RepID=A0ABR0T271_9HYPO
MDSDYSYEDPDEPGPSNPKLKRRRDSIHASNASLIDGQEGSESEGSEYVADDASSVSENEEGQPSPRKRHADDTIARRPFKRQRSELNFAYLELLNKDIVDAAQRTLFEDLPDLPPSQIGLTYWSSYEKQKFFEILAHHGKTNVSAIALALGSKSIVEVSHYISFLQEARNKRHDTMTRSILEPYEYPAAVEISQQCIHAQEEAADEISLRQEIREEQRERNRWDETWDITPKIAKKFSKEARDASGGQVPPFAQLFHLSRWLELSGRMFMNSSIPGNNWNFIEPDPPSVWATAFEDFHSLAISITRRLVQTTLFMAMSRIKSKRDGGSRMRDLVQLQDAEAAIASLGMTPNRNERWIKSARRLRLDVYEDPPEGDEDHEEDPMSYDEVERQLSGGSTDMALSESPYTTQQPSSEEEEFEELQDFSDSSRSPSPADEEERAIKQEAAEVFVHAAAAVRHDKPAKNALKARIASERQKEQHADDWDEHTSYRAELDMWNILQKKPPMDLPRKQDPGPPKRSHYDVEGIYPAGRDWMRKLDFYSEWETLPQPEDDEE